ncbi:MAG: Rieske (2Fe-2S) protein [Thermoguttaceae bacterium]|jgi:Rieske Fe-S protein
MTCQCHPSPDNRRGFLAKAAAWVFGLSAYGVPVAAAVAAFLNPWRQKGPSGQWIRVTTLSALPVGAAPQRFPLVAERTDAWTRYAAEAIGAVHLRRTGDKEAVALSAICPHAGCGVGYEAKESGFFCPCHKAHFDRDGKRTDAKSISPRDMDSLECEIRNASEVWVRFENFKTGTTQKIARA